MSRSLFSEFSRRRLLQNGALAGAGLALGGDLFAASKANLPLITKVIPATGEKIPVIGIGTNAFRSSNYDAVRAVLKRMHELGGTLIDTAASYGDSEVVIGRALADLGIRDKMILSSKFNAAGNGYSPQEVGGRESLERSLRRLKTQSIDIFEVHKLDGLDELMPVMQEYKKAGKIRYLGVTTYRNDEHDRIAQAMRKYRFDFIQIDYSLANRSAAAKVFPIALERKVAVMLNVPLGGRRGSLLQETGGRELPKWAAEFNAASWSQFFLKYGVSHPAVTCAVPGSTKLEHLEDNQMAGRGRLPDAGERKKMEEFWDSKS